MEKDMEGQKFHKRQHWTTTVVVKSVRRLVSSWLSLSGEMMALRPKSPKVQRRYQRKREICTWNSPIDPWKIASTINQQFSRVERNRCKVFFSSRNESKGISKARGEIDPQWTTKVPWQRTAPSASVLPWNASKKGAFSAAAAAAAGKGGHFRSCLPI